MSEPTEALARALCARASHPGYCDLCERTAERILADPGPLLDTLPDDALIEALVKRGVLTEVTRECCEIVAEVDGERVYQHHSDDPRYLREQLTMHPRRYRPGSRVERGTTRWLTSEGVTDWQEADR